ncbi:MAG: hypothetical protein ACKPKO_45915, partial [Candidatus Fonsibacter sp.]
IRRYEDTNVEQRERLSGIKRSYQLRVVLYTQARNHDPDKEPLPQDEAVERRIETNKRKIRKGQAQGAAAVLDGTPDGQGTQRQGHQSAKGKADDKRHTRVQTAVSHLHDRRQLQGTGAEGSGLPGRNLYSRMDNHWRHHRRR